MLLTPGSRLGTYEIVGPLGAGGMGEVYRARDLRLGRDIALKVLPETLARDADHLARLEREARTVAGLNHPNIVTLHSVEDEDGVRFLTMELIEGQSLADLVMPGGLPLDRVLEVAIGIADALSPDDSLSRGLDGSAVPALPDTVFAAKVVASPKP